MQTVEKARDDRKLKITVIVIPVVVGAGMILVGPYICRRRHLHEAIEKKRKSESQEEDLDLPFFDLSTISTATNSFSENNKLGEGGFGPVYRGTLERGQEIAVKRLSKYSGQGVNEFKNEVKFIAKLQHRNLIRFLNYCIDGEEKLLIYEYMPNKSLDSFIFEITSGKKSRGFTCEKPGPTLIGHAWKLMKEGKVAEIIDMCLRDTYDNIEEVLRCIHVGLLFVQQSPDYRPNMSTVVLVLSGDSVSSTQTTGLFH